MLPPISELNALDEDGFMARLAPLFEGAPAFCRRLAVRRPYRSYDDLLDRALAVAQAMPESDQLELIDSHPRIGAPPASVSALSRHEQGYQREPGTAELQAKLDALNKAYESRFGFRFVIFVAGRPRSAIVPIIERALVADREAEKRRALIDIISIARDRAARLGLAEEER
jgi:2-oxo-4-hydroxy-4-carboxy--5-ureidoimidazoline (OHCU) decarboxylase